MYNIVESNIFSNIKSPYKWGQDGLLQFLPPQLRSPILSGFFSLGRFMSGVSRNFGAADFPLTS